MAIDGKKKIIISVIAAVLAVLIIIVLALFIPRAGKKRIDVWSADSQFSIENVQSLEAGSEQFKILMFTDLQLWADVSDNNETYDLMDELVEKADPDMIILPGDNVSGLTTDILLKGLIKHMDSYKIPWACTFGNHDAEGNATLAWQSDRYEESEYCMFERGPSNLYGMGNYAINITRGGKIDKTLFFFDLLRGQIFHCKCDFIDYIMLDTASLIKSKHNGFCLLIPRRMPAQQLKQKRFVLCPGVQIRQPSHRLLQMLYGIYT